MRRPDLLLLASLPLVSLGLLFARTAHAGGPQPNPARYEFFPTVCASGPHEGEACDPLDNGNPCPDSDPPPDPPPTVLKYCLPVQPPSKPKLNGILTLMADAKAGDNDTFPEQYPVVTALLEIKKSGQTFMFTKSFQANGAWPVLGAWFPFDWDFEGDNEDDVHDYDSETLYPGNPNWKYMPFAGALDVLAFAVRDTATQLFAGKFDLTSAGVRVDLVKQTASDDAAQDVFPGRDLGRAARYSITFRFPGAVPQ